MMPALVMPQTRRLWTGAPRLRNAARVAILGSVLALALLGLLAGQLVMAEDASKERLLERYTARAVLGRSFVEAYVSDLQRRLEVAGEIALQGEAPTAADLARTARLFEFQASVLLDDQGRLLQVFPDKPELIGRDMTVDYAHLRQAAAGVPAVSIVVPAAATAAPIVAFAVPIDTPSGRRVFSGGFDLSTTPLGAFLTNASPVSGSNAHIVDTDGAIVASDDPDDRGRMVDHDRPLGEAMSRRSARSYTGRFDRDETTTFYTVQSIPETPWRIVFDAPTDELFSPLEAGRRGPWVMFSAFALASAMFVVMLTRVVHERQGFAQAAEVDGLTGIANRRHLDRELVHLAARPGTPYAVLMIDIDHFKLVNDRFGHQHGDQVLRQVVALIARNVRPSDLVGRWGGEEFMIILPGSDLPGAVVVAERIRRSVDDATFTGDDLAVTVSIGAAVHAPGGPPVGERADAALYQAKHEGRNRVVTDLATVGP